MEGEEEGAGTCGEFQGGGGWRGESQNRRKVGHFEATGRGREEGIDKSFWR